MVKMTVYGDTAKELVSLGAFGDFKVDGMCFSLSYKSVEGRDTVTIEITELKP